MVAITKLVLPLGDEAFQSKLDGLAALFSDVVNEVKETGEHEKKMLNIFASLPKVQAFYTSILEVEATLNKLAAPPKHLLDKVTNGKQMAEELLEEFQKRDDFIEGKLIAAELALRAPEPVVVVPVVKVKDLNEDHEAATFKEYMDGTKLTEIEGEEVTFVEYAVKRSLRIQMKLGGGDKKASREFRDEANAEGAKVTLEKHGFSADSPGFKTRRLTLTKAIKAERINWYAKKHPKVEGEVNDRPESSRLDAVDTTQPVRRTGKTARTAARKVGKGGSRHADLFEKPEAGSMPDIDAQFLGAEEAPLQ